jgi:hypothetical protein
VSGCAHALPVKASQDTDRWCDDLFGVKAVLADQPLSSGFDGLLFLLLTDRMAALDDSSSSGLADFLVTEVAAIWYLASRRAMEPSLSE